MRKPSFQLSLAHRLATVRTETKASESERLALAATEVAELLGISARHVWKLHASGQLPQPVRLGRSVRWNRVELVRWLEAGCPARDKWQGMQESRR